MERELQKKEEAIQKTNIGDVKGVSYGKAIPTYFHSFHSPESQTYYSTWKMYTFIV